MLLYYMYSLQALHVNNYDCGNIFSYAGCMANQCSTIALSPMPWPGTRLSVLNLYDMHDKVMIIAACVFIG